jgi:hypothetical protein
MRRLGSGNKAAMHGRAAAAQGDPDGASEPVVPNAEQDIRDLRGQERQARRRLQHEQPKKFAYVIFYVSPMC